MNAPRKLSEWVDTDTSDVRANLLWKRVRAAAKTSKPSSANVRRFAAGTFVAAAAAAIVFFATHHRSAEQHAQVAAQPVVYDENGAMTLGDGSHVRLRDSARVRIEHADAHKVEITLVQGTAEFDVVHVPGRDFVVHAERIDVVDVGTRFVVTRDAASTRVEVREGRVDLRDPAGVLPTRTISAGESWSNTITASSRAETAVESASAAASSPPVRKAALTPKELLEAADTARIAGHSREAATLLDEVRRHHRGDVRAALAAFQLGRLRLDALSDPSGAVEAFDDTIALAPNAPFREDAEARRVEALERARDPRCHEARETYLTRYPKGLHVVEVKARCGP
jgi:hypothetical protein